MNADPAAFDAAACGVRAESSTFKCFAKPPLLIATDEHLHLPLHATRPPVKLLSWEKADSIVRHVSSKAEEEVWTTFAAHYRNCDAAAALWESRDTSLDIDPRRGSRLLPGDITTLLESAFAARVGNLSELSQLDVFIACKIFTVVERFKHRRRIIAWPRALNVAERRILSELKARHVTVPFGRVKTLRNRAVKRYAAHLDLTKFFQQFELLTRKRFAFVHNGVVYELSTVPTGAVGPPLLAQILVRAVVTYSIRVCGTTHLIVFDVMIDNARICSDDADAISATWNMIMTVFSDIGCTVGEMMAPSELPNYEFLGIAFDHASVSVSLTEKMFAKVEHAIDIIEFHAAQTTLADCLALFGTTVWVAQALDLPLAELYWVVKFTKRISNRARNASLQQSAPIWNSITKLWAGWLRHALTYTGTVDQPSGSLQTIHAYTDASDDGWGAVVFDESGMAVLAGKWSAREHLLSINRKELLAVWYMLLKYKPPHPGEPLRSMWLYIDNTTALSHVTKRLAGNYVANSIIMGIEELKANRGICIDHVEYVNTAANPADAPSRWACASSANTKTTSS